MVTMEALSHKEVCSQLHFYGKDMYPPSKLSTKWYRWMAMV